MLHTIRYSKLAASLLSALIVLGMWDNAMAAVFCPHMMGGSDCCLMQISHANSHHRTSESGTMNHDHMDHASMSGMDMQDMSMDMADVQMSDMQNDGTVSQPNLDRESLSDLSLEVAQSNVLTPEAMAQPNDPCSHCMMHSRSGARFPVSIAGQNNPSYQVVAADAATGVFKSVPPSLAFVELHDHSRPESRAPVYILVSAFR